VVSRLSQESKANKQEVVTVAPSKYEYHRRLLSAVVAVAFLLVASLASPARPISNAIAGFTGIMCGLIVGKTAWLKVLKKIDKSNSVVFYFSDSGLYVLIFLAFLVAESPRPIIELVGTASHYGNVFGIGIVLLAAIAAGENSSLAFFVRRHELQSGPLRVRRFYAPSVSGIPGMLGKTAIVLHSCKPNGTVEIGSEIWNAMSIDGSTIPNGTSVVIRDVVGLQLQVEKEPASLNESGNDELTGHAS
jgi:hypothetical protein